jgi:Putative peptidoglycan binding domain
MKTKRMFFLIGAAALSLSTIVAFAATTSPMMTQSTTARPAPRFTSTTMTGTHHFRHFRNRTFIFIDAFGFPVFSPYPYSYYPYDYYGYNDYGYGNVRLVVEVQRRLARAGYYRGPIDGILGPQTRRAIRAYERDYNLPAYGVIDRPLLRTLGLG